LKHLNELSFLLVSVSAMSFPPAGSVDDPPPQPKIVKLKITTVNMLLLNIAFLSI